MDISSLCGIKNSLHFQLELVLTLSLLQKIEINQKYPDSAAGADPSIPFSPTSSGLSRDNPAGLSSSLPYHYAQLKTSLHSRGSSNPLDTRSDWQSDYPKRVQRSPPASCLHNLENNKSRSKEATVPLGVEHLSDGEVNDRKGTNALL